MFIDDNSESFLTVQWTYPDADKAGLYRCEANGMNIAGYPSELIQTVNVTSEQPHINQIVDKVSELQRQLDRQQDIERNQSQNIDNLNSLLNRQESIISQQANLIDTFMSLIKNQSELINKQQFQVNTIQKQLNIIIEDRFGSDFHISATYKNHIYLMSNGDWNNSTVAEQVCKDYNGYLAEVGDADEDTFVNEFINNFTSVDIVLVSGTDQDHEGVWTYTGSSQPIPYINWVNGELNSPVYNCMVKYRGREGQVEDSPCSHTYADRKFLCEANLQ